MFAGNGGEGMPRPRKWRRVCCLPESRRFGPLDLCAGETVTMAVDEYETIRLIDLDGLTQEQCAAQMGISRTTVQGIYDSARKKLARSLVEGEVLVIEGGEYRLCDGQRRGCGCGREACPHRRCGRRFDEPEGHTGNAMKKETEGSNENHSSDE